MLHVVVGLGLLIPVLGYLVKHERRRRGGNWSHYKLLDYLAGLVLLVSYGSGFVVSGQALFGTRLLRSWDQDLFVYHWIAQENALYQNMTTTRTGEFEVKQKKPGLSTLPTESVLDRIHLT